MVTFECRCERTEGVTLVELRVAVERPHRIRIENRLDGPVWSPRRRGVPAAGWDGSGVEVVVAPDAPRGFGYATPAMPADPPAELAGIEPAGDESRARPVASGHADRPESAETPDEPDTSDEADTLDVVPDVEPSATGVVRALGDPTVPRDAVPIEGGRTRETVTSARVPAPFTGGETARKPADRDGSAIAGRLDDRTRDGGFDERTTDAELDERTTDAEHDRDTTDTAAHVRRRAASLRVPRAVRAWFRDVERRLDAFEASRRGGRDGAIPALATTVEADRLALDRVARRADALAGRSESDGRAGRTAARESTAERAEERER